MTKFKVNGETIEMAIKSRMKNTSLKDKASQVRKINAPLSRAKQAMDELMLEVASTVELEYLKHLQSVYGPLLKTKVAMDKLIADVFQSESNKKL